MLVIFDSREKNSGRASSPTIFNIGQNWGKIENYPPNVQHKSAPLLYPYTKKLFRKTFVQYVTAWLVRIRIDENATNKNILFHGEEKMYKSLRKMDIA